jgi:hypothetical protein
MDRREFNNIRHRLQARQGGDRKITFYCECTAPDCRAALALPASVFADLRRQGIPVLFADHVPDQDAQLAQQQASNPQ